MPESYALPAGAALEQEEANFVLDFVTTMPLSNGRGFFSLQPWQEEALTQFYGTQTTDELGHRVRLYQYLYLELPKKNGKSELAAALGIYHLTADGEPSGEIYVVAADRDNAGIVFNAACYMLEHHPVFAKWLRKGTLRIIRSTKTIYYRPTSSVMRVLSAEAYSKHGYKPSCVIFDELHAQPNRELWDVMTFGSGSARDQPAFIVLTTAGDDPDRASIGWEIHSKALDILRARGLAPSPPGDCRVYEDDPAWLPIMYGISALTGDDEDAIAALDIYDEELWKRCNPGIGTTVKLSTVRQEARNAKRSEAAERLFRWLRLNQWVSVKTVGWIPLPVYDKTQWPYPKQEGRKAPTRAERMALREELRGKTCYGGLDLSKTTDLTALVLLFPPQEGLEKWLAVFWGIWRPEEGVREAEERDHVPYRDWARAGYLTLCPGETVDYGMVEEAIYQAAEAYDLKLLGYDPHLSWTLAPRLAAGQPERGRGPIPLAETPQNMQNMSPPMKQMEKEIRDHQMLHEHNSCARASFGNTRCRVDGNENIKPMKNLSTGRIDVTVAWINARMAAMMAQASGPALAQALEREDYTL